MKCKNCEKSTSGFCNEHKPSELFEGENSSLKKTFEKATGYIGKVELIEKIREEIKAEILSKLPEKMNENPDWEQLYANHRKIGFNSCLSKVKEIIKNI